MKNTLQARSESVGSAVPALGFLALVGLVGIGCSDGTLKSQGLGDAAAGGQGGSASSGGATGLGGGTGGGPAATGGAGGMGGVNTGGKATGGSGGGGGTSCPPIMCGAMDCPNGTMPNPFDSCGCAVCAPSDAPVCPRSCPAVRCAYGTVREPVCGCETCITPDGGPEAGSGIDAAKDASVDLCLALPCALPSCAAGYSIVTHACGCPTCEPADAGADTGKLACVGLDECACMANGSCSVVSDACYCPFPQCGSGSCVCGGGKFIACAPATLNTCAAAKSRVASLCPTLKGPTFDGLCQQAESACYTKCLNEVTTCGEASCSFCEGCDCASDAFMRCVSSCMDALKQ